MTHRKPGPKPNSANTRQRILDAARQLIAERGVEQLRLQDVASAVGIRPPSVFGHFKGLEDVTESVFRQVLENLTEALDIHPSTNVAEDLRITISRLTAFLATDAANVRLLLQQLASNGRTLARFESGNEMVDSIDLRVEALLNRGIASGQFRRVRVHDFMAVVVGTLLARLAWHNYVDWQAPDWPKQLADIEDDVVEIAYGFLGVESVKMPVRASA